MPGKKNLLTFYFQSLGIGFLCNYLSVKKKNEPKKFIDRIAWSKTMLSGNLTIIYCDKIPLVTENYFES